MVEEALRLLTGSGGQDYLDLTLGGGGHARAILSSNEKYRLTGVDRDLTVLRETERALREEFGERFHAIRARFDLAEEAEGGPQQDSVDGVLLDLGMSSLQIGAGGRGFSFERDDPLDMRMDPSTGKTAADLLRELPEREIEELLYRGGEERTARAIARAIVTRRRSAPLRRTGELADLVHRTVGSGRRGKIDPATRTFQALRIAVNDELGCLERVLPKAEGWLRSGGRLVIIAFHSGEDRIVKRFLGQAEGRELSILTPRALRPAREEVQRNARARSARLRAAERRR